MRKLDVGAAFSKAWQVFSENWLMLIAVYLVIAIAGSIVSSLLSPTVQINYYTNNMNLSEMYPAIYQSLYSPGTWFTSLVRCCLDLGMTVLLLGLVKGTRCDFSLDCWKLPFMSYVNYILANILVSIIVGIGLFFCILPGIWLSSRLILTTSIIANDPSVNCIDAIKKSWALTEGNTGSMILLILGQILIAICGFLCCIIGIFPAAIVAEMSTVVAFVLLDGVATNNSTTASSSESAGPQTL